MTATLPVRQAPATAPAPPRADRLVSWCVGTIGAVTLLLWVAGGGLKIEGMTGLWLAVGQLAGFTAAIAAMAGLVLVARPSWLEQRAGLDQLWLWHRLAGMTTVFALLVHIGATLMGFSNTRPTKLVSELIDLLRTQSWMVAALVGALIFFTVALTAWRRIRNRMSYETWYTVHLCGYLAVVLAFGHQLTVGTDLAGDTPVHLLFRAWWIVLALATLGAVLWSRLGALIVGTVTGRAVVTRVTYPARDTAAIECRVRPGLARRTRAGQFFQLRFLTRDLWWQAHPISMSAAPRGDRLRFTIRAVGDGSLDIARVRPGTRLLLEGPYGRFTAERAGGRPVALVGGGVGLAPLRAILEECGPHQRPVVVARVPDQASLPHADELQRLVDERNGRLFVLAGPRAQWRAGQPFTPELWAQGIPDIAGRDVFVCGPPSMERAVERGLRGAGVAPARIHIERFGV